jgi:hypothetical protein
MTFETPAHPTADYVLATYREIALRFSLGGPHAARTKAKRAGWSAEPPNHPADPLRIRVPREVWDQAGIKTPPLAGRHEGADTRSLKALETALATLREALAAADARASWAEEAERSERARSEALRETHAGELARITDEHGKLIAVIEAKAQAAEAGRERAEQALAGERSRADVLRERLEAAERGQREAQEAAEGLRQAEMVRQARGLVARLRAAWRGS